MSSSTVSKNSLKRMSSMYSFFFTGTIKDTSGPLVIPLISKNKWREGDKEKLDKKKDEKKKKEVEKDDKDLTIQERAAKEILEESRKVGNLNLVAH